MQGRFFLYGFYALDSRPRSAGLGYTTNRGVDQVGDGVERQYQIGKRNANGNINKSSKIIKIKYTDCQGQKLIVLFSRRLRVSIIEQKPKTSIHKQNEVDNAVFQEDAQLPIGQRRQKHDETTQKQ
jgi:hypothetical protein